jgi:quercetin dioxygenase-like cupin family protein
MKMKKINDNNGRLLAFHISFSSISEEKNFVTSNDLDFQVASFNLKKETVIEKHYHPTQERLINTTHEVIVILDGTIEVSIYDTELNIVDKITASRGDTVALFSGGHGIKVIEDCKLIETKQGPFIEEIDKVRF